MEMVQVAPTGTADALLSGDTKLSEFEKCTAAAMRENGKDGDGWGTREKTGTNLTRERWPPETESRIFPL